jgi:AcrR family transcriptional regulator
VKGSNPLEPAAPAKEGHQRIRDADRTKLTILRAAREEFAAHGLAGASADNIAKRANVDKRLIFYYFSSKDNLFSIVLEQALSEMRRAEGALDLREVEPVDAIRQLIGFTWSFHLAHPELISLFASENLSGAVHIDRSDARANAMPLVETLDSILERGRRAGLFRRAIDPMQMYISITALCHFYLANCRTLSAFFNADLGSPREQALRLSHVTELILGSILC